MQCVIIIAFLCLLFVHGSEGITTHSVTGCSKIVLLNCSNTEMIHVERITYYKGTDCNQAVTDLQVCGEPVTGSDTRLSPACNGKTSCNENLYYSYCPGSKAAKVDYRCIPGNDTKDMCDEIIIENTNRIFLSTPNYPTIPTFTSISPCKCFIRGSSITSIQILELILHTSNDGNKSSLEISYGDVLFKTESFRLVINKRLSTASATAEIIFNHNNIRRQYLWIEVQGANMRVSCATSAKNVTTSSSPSSSSSTSTTTPQTADIKSHSQVLIQSTPSSSPKPDSSSQTDDIRSYGQEKDTIITLAVLLSLCLLIICISAIIIIVFLRRKKLRPGERESNLYSGLDRTQRVSGNEGSYQELNTRNSTVQYYNDSQDTQNTNHDYQHVS